MDGQHIVSARRAQNSYFLRPIYDLSVHQIIKERHFGAFTDKTSLPFRAPPAAARRYAQMCRFAAQHIQTPPVRANENLNSPQTPHIFMKFHELVSHWDFH